MNTPAGEPPFVLPHRVDGLDSDLGEGRRWVVQDRLPGQLRRAHQSVVVQGAGEDRYATALAPQAAVGDDGAQAAGVGVEEAAVQAAENDPVGVEDVDESGESQAEAVDQRLGGRADGGSWSYRVRIRSLACWRRDTSGPGSRPAAMRKARGSASTSRQPRLPQ